MSIEVQSEPPVVQDTAPPSPAPSIRPAARPALWRRRRYQIAGAVIVVLLIAAFVSNNLIARQYTPDGSVREYLSALQAGDASKAWDAIQVTAPTAQIAANATDRSALQAALAGGKPDIKNFSVTQVSQLDSTTASVEVTYDSSSGSQQAKFVAKRSGQTDYGFYPVWQVVLAPTILQITLPAGSNGVGVDGKELALPVGQSSVAVLPLVHKLQFNGTAMLVAQTLSVDAFNSTGQTVAYKPTLTTAGLTQAKTAVSAYFDSCAKQRGLSPTGCPQSLSSGFVSSGQWQVVGDPTQDLSVGFDSNLNPIGSGHFQMVLAYREAGTTGTLHTPSAGGYNAALALTANDVTVTSISPETGLPGIQRPSAATDQAAESLVAKAFAQCAAARSASPADCPQGLAAVDVSSATWTLSGDPLSGASVSFDQQTGIFTVQGTFNMTTTYYSSGYPYSRPSYTTTYKAYLFWDGQALRLVTIAGDF